MLAAGLVLLGAGCAVLGWSSRPRLSVSHQAPPTVADQLLGVGNAPSQAEGEVARAHALLAGLPIIFEPNQGQADLNPSDPRAEFVSRGPGYSLFLGREGAILSRVSQKPVDRAHQSVARVESVEMKLVGANAGATLSATDPLPGKSHYFIGNDPSRWRTSIPQFARVRYESVYPGIDLVFYGHQGRLEYDFQVAPGADPARAELEFNGAKKLELREGALVIQSADESIKLEKPVVYQESEGRRQLVEGRFVLRGTNRAGFAIGPYDRSRKLVIDPYLSFSTYFGGSGDELASSVVVDSDFNIYLAGSTTSPNLPVTAGVFQPTLNSAAGAQNVYIAKITPPLGSLAATLDDVTYLGGSGQDTPAGIKVDGGFNPYVAGTTTSDNFPTTPTTAYQTAPETGSVGTSHVFVTRLNANFENLGYSSYLSGNNTDAASGMTIDPAGNLYVTGTTYSSDTATASDQFPASTYPEQLAFQSLPRAAIQFFVSKVDTNRSGIGSIVYSTYFGGGTFNPPTGTTLPTVIGGGITVDSNGNIYFSGGTNFTYTGLAPGTDFPILNAYQPCLDTIPPTTIVNPPTCTYSTPPVLPDAFVAKLNPSAAQGQQLQWSTYLGGAESDSSAGVALDSGAANVYVVGTTNSQPFVSTSTTYASYQYCLNNLYTTSNSPTDCTTQTNPAPTDAFVARLTNPTNTTGTPTNVALNYFSYLGGANNEEGLAITVDANSGAMVTGWTQSPLVLSTATPPEPTSGSFPVSPYPNSIQQSLYGFQDAFVARLNTAAVTGQTTVASWANYWGGSVTSSGGAATNSGTGIALDNNQETYLVGETNATDLRLENNLPQNEGGDYNGGYDAFVTQLQTAESISIVGVLTLGPNQTYVSAGNPATFTYTLTNNGPDPATNIVVIDNLSGTGVPVTAGPSTISGSTCTTSSSGISCGPISLQSGSTATVTITLTPTASSSNQSGCGSSGGSGSPEFFNGGTVEVLAPGNIVLAETSVSAQMTDFSMAVCPANQSVAQAGDTAPYQVQLTPNPLYGSQITISCSNLPAATTCGFSPNATVTLQSTSGVTVGLNVVTTARPVTPTTALLLPRRFYAIWLMVPGLALVGMGIGGNRRRRRIAGLLLLCWILLLVVLLPACSKSATQAQVSGTPAGSYNIVVTAASDSDSKTQTIGLNVP